MSNIFEGHKFIKNQSLVLTDFQDVSVTGLFVGFNRDKSRLELQIVSDLRTKKFLGKIKFYYSSNVKNIQIMTPEQKVDIINEVLCPENTSISKFQQETIEKNIEKFALIQKTDERYHKAVQQLSAQPSIGLSWEGCENGRSTKLSMLALSTNTNIFIFDIIYLGNKVPKELKTVLKDTSICKVIHNALLLCDALFHSYDVEIANIFDTMVC